MKHLILAAAICMACTTGAQAEPGPRTGGMTMLELGGAKAGFLKSVEGGGVSAPLIEETNPDHFIRKHIGTPKYGDLALEVSVDQSKLLNDWIAASWTRNYQRKNGSIIACDYDLNARSEREFSHALISEVTIPAMDASAKDPAYLTVKVAPELIKTKSASGKCSTAGQDKQKAWLPANFKFELAGLDTSKVMKIESFTVKQALEQHSDGHGTTLEPTKLDFPNLRLTVSEAGAKGWLDWHEDFVIKGNNAVSNEKEGAIVLLSSDRSTELARIVLHGVGIFGLGLEKAERTTAEDRYSVDLYVERMEFQTK